MFSKRYTPCSPPISRRNCRKCYRICRPVIPGKFPRYLPGTLQGLERIRAMNVQKFIPQEFLWLIPRGPRELLGGCAGEPMAMPAPPPPTVAPLADTRVYVY